METPNKPNPEHNSGKAEAHIRSAHQILKALQEKIGEHPEIGAAITKLEMALNDLAIRLADCCSGEQDGKRIHRDRAANGLPSLQRFRWLCEISVGCWLL